MRWGWISGDSFLNRNKSFRIYPADSAGWQNEYKYLRKCALSAGYCIFELSFTINNNTSYQIKKGLYFYSFLYE